MTAGKFFIRSATRFDYNLIRYGLKRFYWPQDPLSVAWENQKTPSLLEFRWTMTKVLNGKNLIAFNDQKTSHFVGFIVNNSWNADATQEILNLAEESKDKRLLTIGILQQRIEKEIDIYNKFNVKDIFLVSNVGVHPDYFHQSLGTQLVQQSEQRAKQLGFKLMMVYATGGKAKSICEKNQMQLIAKFKYSDFIDKFKSQIDMFNSSLNDKELLVFIKEI